MKKEYFATDFVSSYAIRGQALEQEYRYYKTGVICKADNLPAMLGCDLGNKSLKSARATVCKGLDIKAHLQSDKAVEFVYLTKSRIAYTMDRAEYIEFVTLFGTATRESKKNGGHAKIRLKHETSALLEWLNERA